MPRSCNLYAKQKSMDNMPSHDQYFQCCGWRRPVNISFLDHTIAWPSFFFCVISFGQRNRCGISDFMPRTVSFRCTLSVSRGAYSAQSHDSMANCRQPFLSPNTSTLIIFHEKKKGKKKKRTTEYVRVLATQEFYPSCSRILPFLVKK